MPTTDVRGRRPWKTSAEDGPWTVCGRRLRKNLGYKGCSRSAGQWPEWPHEGSWEAQVAGRNAYRNHVRFCKRFCQCSVSVLSAFAPLRDAKEVPGRAPRSTGKPKFAGAMADTNGTLGTILRQLVPPRLQAQWRTQTGTPGQSLGNWYPPDYRRNGGHKREPRDNP